MPKVIMIDAVHTSAAGRVYVTDSNGEVYLPRTKEMDKTIRQGQFANVIEQVQTKTRDKDGKLVDLEPHEVRKNWIITGVYENEMQAIKSKAAPQLFEQKTAAYLKQQESVIAKEFAVDASLAAAI